LEENSQSKRNSISTKGRDNMLSLLKTTKSGWEGRIAVIYKVTILPLLAFHFIQALRHSSNHFKLITSSISVSIMIQITSVLVLLTVATSASAAATTVFPASSGATAAASAIPVSGSFDGGMKKFERNRKNLHQY
jgi:hypothetical protein